MSADPLDADPQVILRQRSHIVLDDDSTITIELLTDGAIALYHRDLLWTYLKPLEAERLVSGISRHVRAAKGMRPHTTFKAQRDCVRCLADEVHDVHETEAERIDRATKLEGLLRAQRAARP